MGSPFEMFVPTPPERSARFLWGTVTNLTPLAVRIDNETTSLYINSNVAGPLSVGARVLVLIAGLDRTIIGPPLQRFYSTSRITNQGSITTETTLGALELIAPRRGNVRLQFACQTYSSDVNDLVSIAIKRNGAVVTQGVQRANSGVQNQSNLYALPALAIAQPGDVFTVTAQRAAGIGSITVAGSPEAPVIFALEYTEV